MSLIGILIGLLNIAIVVAVLLLIGAIFVWVVGSLGWSPPAPVQKGYMIIVALVALVLIVQLLAGVPSIHIISGLRLPSVG
jgi:hypothetical protein